MSQMPTSTTLFARILSASHQQNVPAERRLKFRYPLGLSVRFRSLSAKSDFSGLGRAVNLSSGGVLVSAHHAVSQHEIGVGARVEMNIEWPFLLDEKIPLQLFAVGQVLRRGTTDFAATLERYHFRTARSLGQPQARSGGDLLEWPPVTNSPTESQP
jgi:hypothetical protein